MGDSVALDSNVVIAVLNDHGGAGPWVQRYQDIYLPLPVVGELRYGALNSNRPEENLRRIERLLSRCHVLDLRPATAEIYARLRLDLKRKGRPIPENDLWIAAACVENEMPLATLDAHFQQVDGLVLEPFGADPTPSSPSA